MGIDEWSNAAQVSFTRHVSALNPSHSSFPDHQHEDVNDGRTGHLQWIDLVGRRAEVAAAQRTGGKGISSSAILEFVDLAEKKVDALHSFMVVRHGHVVAEGWWSPYRRNLRMRSTH